MTKRAPLQGPSVIFLALSWAVFGTGCTFYTACPPPDGNMGAAGNQGGGAGNGAGGGGEVPDGEWINVSGNLAGIPSECGNMSALAAKPDEDLLIAGISQNGLWSSVDGGGSWEELGTGKGSDPIVNRMGNIVFDPDDSDRWWEGGIYNGGGAYETRDDGLTFTMLGGVEQQGDLLSVDLSDPDRQTLLIGGHETGGAITISTDGGASWGPIGKGLPSGTNCTFPHIIDAQTFLVGCGGYGGSEHGIYRSTDAGQSWKRVSTDGGSGAPLHATDQTIYWLSPDGALTRSSDAGKTWTRAIDSGTIVGPGIIELPDQRLAALGKRYVMVSADHGATWQLASSALPYDDGNPATGVAYSRFQKAFFIWHGTCGFDGPVPVPDDAIMRYDFDYEAP